MTVLYNSGPINIESGNSATITIEFLSSATGVLTTPSTTNMTMTYINTSSSSQTDTVTLTQSNSFYSGTWSSTSAALGLATYVVTCTGSTAVQTTGQVRVIQRQSSY